MYLFFAIFSSTTFASVKLNPLLVHAIGKTQLSTQSSAHCHAHAVVSENLRVDGVPVASTAEDYQSGFYDDLG